MSNPTRFDEMWKFTKMLENAGVPYVKTYTPSNETYIIGIGKGDNTLLLVCT